MPKPNATVDVEPVVSGSLVCQPLAPGKSGGQPQVQLPFGLWVTNKESSTIVFESVTVTFPGSSEASRVFSGTETETNLDSTDDSFTYTPGMMKDIYSPAKQYIVVARPLPPSVRLTLRFEGFSDPIVVDRPLALHITSIPEGSYLWPGSALDLRPGEYWQGQSASHWSGGTQLFAYDLVVVAWDDKAGRWSATLPCRDGTRNEDHRIWGMPIRAMADGTVVEFRDDVVTNPKPGEVLPGVPNSGNNFRIRHGDEDAFYSHLQAGTLNPNLMTPGAAVRAGTEIGLLGNSGW